MSRTTLRASCMNDVYGGSRTVVWWSRWSAAQVVRPGHPRRASCTGLRRHPRATAEKPLSRPSRARSNVRVEQHGSAGCSMRIQRTRCHLPSCRRRGYRAEGAAESPPIAPRSAAIRSTGGQLLVCSALNRGSRHRGAAAAAVSAAVMLSIGARLILLRRGLGWFDRAARSRSAIWSTAPDRAARAAVSRLFLQSAAARPSIASRP